MKLCFFVHECFLETGHTRAMLEVIRAAEPGTIQELHLIYFEGGDNKELLPEFSGKIVHHKVPFRWMFPFLFKAIFYQLYCFFLIRFTLPTDSIKIGIGTACLNVDMVNVQFVQSQWEPLYFKNKNPLSLRNIYKRILFKYFYICEVFLYRKESLIVMSLSQLVTDYLQEKFQIKDKNIETIYSSTNLSHFPMPAIEKNDVYEDLVKTYRGLESLNLDKPIFLFVGAYERKGLDKALHYLKDIKDSQIIVIGKPESGVKYKFSSQPNVISIPFTKELKKFYELSDVFIFPTVYEPFGLVISEAASMGNLTLVPRNNVGASEILEGLESVLFLDETQIDFRDIKPLSLDEKRRNAQSVRQRLSQYSWKKAASQFVKLLSSF